jgi:diacylglycerol kinase family enzyme
MFTITPESAFNAARLTTNAIVGVSTSFAIKRALKTVVPVTNNNEKYMLMIAGWGLGTLAATQTKKLSDKEFRQFQLLFFDEVKVQIPTTEETPESTE